MLYGGVLKRWWRTAGAVILEDIALGGGFDVLNTEMMSISEVRLCTESRL